jgi:hypothetical protein
MFFVFLHYVRLSSFFVSFSHLPLFSFILPHLDTRPLLRHPRAVPHRTSKT